MIPRTKKINDKIIAQILMESDLNTGQIDDTQSPLSYDQFAAGVLYAAGITDTQSWIPNAEVLHGLID